MGVGRCARVLVGRCARVGVGRRARVLVALVAVGLVAGACTTAPSPVEPTPSPSPSVTASDGASAAAGGRRVTLVVPPSSLVAPAEAEALARAGQELVAEPPEGIDEVRVLRAVSEAFVIDLAEVAVDDGDALVCIVGTGTAELVLELARARRDGRFCTTDARIAGGPVNLAAAAVDPVLLVDVGAIAIGTAPAPVGLLVSGQLGDGEALRERFTSTVAEPVQPAAPTAGASPSPAAGTAPASPGPTPSPSPTAQGPLGPTSPQPPFVWSLTGTGIAAQTNAAQELAAQRPSAALVLATPAGNATVAAVGATGAGLVVVADWAVDAEGVLPPGVLVALTVDWGAVLRSAVGAARDEEGPQVRLLGAASGVVGVLSGQAADADAAAQRAQAFLDQDTP